MDEIFSYQGLYSNNNPRCNICHVVYRQILAAEFVIFLGVVKRRPCDGRNAFDRELSQAIFDNSKDV